MGKTLLAAVIVLYTCYVVYRKYKNIKKGKFCSCGCDECPSQKKCHK